MLKRILLTALPILYMVLIWIQSSHSIEAIKTFLGVAQ